MAFDRKEYRREYMRRRRAESPEKVYAANAKWCKLNPHKVRQYRTSALQRELARLEELAGRPKPSACEICGNGELMIHFDHSHVTGKFRGWLCVNCNIALGMMNDDPARLRALASYLEEHAD